MKLCIDCRWCEVSELHDNFHKCVHSDMLWASQISLVTGKPRQDEAFCQVEREYDISKCGPEGRLWEAK
jgi:hypothetical protein